MRLGASQHASELDRQHCGLVSGRKGSVFTWGSRGWEFEKDLAPYRIGKHSNPENSPKIHIKNTKKNTIFFGIYFGVFYPYFACGGVFLFCRGPSFLQGQQLTFEAVPGNRAGGPLAICFQAADRGCRKEFYGQPGIAEKMLSVKFVPASYTPKGLLLQKKMLSVNL